MVKGTDVLVYIQMIKIMLCMKHEFQLDKGLVSDEDLMEKNEQWKYKGLCQYSHYALSTSCP